MTHVHSCEERLFLDTQAIALSGKYGKEPNRLNFYEGLNTDELRQELVARQIYDIPGSKQGRLQLLKDTLCGVQRVPSLLLLDPTVDPKSSEYNLADYCVLPFEPLHDLKGHLSKILPDLTKVIQNTALKSEINHYLMDFFKKPNLYGSDYREAIIQILHIIAKSELDERDPLFVFIATIVKISEMVYSQENKRTPRQCLQFYNCAFLHQEPYHELFAPEKMSVYCHSLLFHGPVQHEFVCSRSINTEGEERLFKQANSAAQNTDHKVENLAVALLTRLQCKQKVSETNSYDLTSSAQSRIQKAAEGLPTYSGSLFTKGFIKCRISRFQTHLQRISHFLLPGKGIWWDKDDMGNVICKDGNNDLESHAEGPNVLLFCNTSYSDIAKRARESWMELQQSQITIPLDAIRSNDREGQLTVHIQGQPMDQTLTCDQGVLNSDFRVDDSESIK